MKKIFKDEILKATGARLENPQIENSQKFDFVEGVGTDTRVSLKNKLFIALRGDVYDAHQFILKAVEAGAQALLIHDSLESLQALSKSEIDRVYQNCWVFKVEDTLRAFQDLALFKRRQSSSIVVGITGSNGKTTSKEFCGAVIGAYRKTHIPKGSFNNHWGVPMTLLSEPEGTEVSVIEMGMNHAGEIQRLCEVAEPESVVVTMVGRAHIEHFGSIDKISEAKEEIYRFAQPQSQRVYNLDNPWTRKMYEKSFQEFPRAKKIISFSEKDSTADVFLKIKSLQISYLEVEGHIHQMQGQCRIPVFGQQNMTNILVAAAMSLSVGLTPEEIWKALPLCRTNWGRNQVVPLQSGAQLLFDGYNANPDSMQALLSNVSLIETSGKKIGVFAQMKELGELAPEAHFELGQKVADSGFDVVWFYGENFESFARGMKDKKFSKTLIVSSTYEESLAIQVASMVNPEDRVLVKGSRSMKLERFVQTCNPVDFTLSKE